jgi:hypothetical protein
VPGSIRDDKTPFRRGKIAVGNIDRDALFPFRFKTVSDEGIIQVSLPVDRGIPFQCFQLVFEDGFRVEKEAPDQGRLAIINTPGRGKPQQVI